MSVGKRIQEIRLKLGYSQQDLAKIAGMQPSTISHFENGRREPSTKNLIKLCGALKISADFLLGITTENERDWHKHCAMLESTLEKILRLTQWEK